MKAHRRKILAAGLLASTVLFFFAVRQYCLEIARQLSENLRQVTFSTIKPFIHSKLPLTHNSAVATLPNLRILPLGDSITYGFRSTSGNGYRDHLFNMLNGTFPSVTYVGSQHSGNMTNNSNEGHPGYMIHDIAKTALPSLALQPNIILIMAGTNDIARPYMPFDAPWRLAALIDFALLACPFSVVIVAQLAPVIKPPEAEEMIRQFNSRVPDTVAARQQVGKKVLMVDMNQKLTSENLYDGVHPDDRGYELIAHVWYEGVQRASQSGWIWEPISVGRSGSESGVLGLDEYEQSLRPEIKDGRTCQICI